MKKLILTALVALSLTGCATGNYEHYAQRTLEMEKADSDRATAKLEALTLIASDPKATSETRVAIGIAIAMMPETKRRELAAPKDPSEIALQAAGIGLQGYLGWLDFFKFGINANRTQGAADPSVIKDAFRAGTVQFGSSN